MNRSNSPCPTNPVEQPTYGDFLRAARGMVRAWCVAVFVALGGCFCVQDPEPVPPAAVPGAKPLPIRHAYAVYDSKNLLIRSPIEAFLAEAARRKAEGTRPISDVYVVSHGWNFTLEESGRLYENYMLSAEETLAQVADCDAGYQPFFIFISWSSVTRPLSEALHSLLPIGLPRPVDLVVDWVDSVAFHLPSNWGETDDAQHIALGGARRRQRFEPSEAWLDSSDSEYQRAIRVGAHAARTEEFVGYEIPVSALLDELIRIPARGAQSPYKTHVIGHSFGAKVAALATFDVAARHFAAEQCKGPGRARLEPVVDSLTLINAALRPPELYYPADIIPPDVPSGKALDAKLETTVLDDIVPFESAAKLIRRKSIAYTEHDSATGWLFSLSNLALNYDAIDETRFTESWSWCWYLPGFVLDSSVVALKTVSIDVWILLSRPVVAIHDVFTETESVADLLENVAFIPFSPLAALKGVGNQGFKNMAVIPLEDLLRTTWLNRRAADYLETSALINAQSFAYLSGGLGRTPPKAGPSFDVYDASSVYNGHIGDATGVSAFALGVLNQILPPGAHGDLRSYKKARGVEKRRRTFHWIYNLTRFEDRACEAH